MQEDQIDIFDNLGDTNFEEVDTSMPVLAAGLYSFEIKDMRRETWKSGKGSSLVIQLALQDEALDVSGERSVNPGFSVFDRISLVAKGRYDPRQPIKRFLEAVGMEDQPFDTSFQSYLGQNIMANVKVVPEQTNPDTGDVYPPKNEISRYHRS